MCTNFKYAITVQCAPAQPTYLPTCLRIYLRLFGRTCGPVKDSLRLFYLSSEGAETIFRSCLECTFEIELLL